MHRDKARGSQLSLKRRLRSCSASSEAAPVPWDAHNGVRRPRGVWRLNGFQPDPSGFSSALGLKIRHKTPRGWFRELKQLRHWGPRSAGAAGIPQCARLLSRWAAAFQQKEAFSGNVQELSLKICWIGPGAQRDSVPSGAGRLRSWEQGAQKPPERSQGVIEAGSQAGTCLKERKQKRFVCMGNKTKECGDFSGLRAAAAFPKWLRFTGKTGFSSKIQRENP